MANVLFAARTALTSTLTTVSASAEAVTHGATAVADLAGAGAAHAASYRRTTEASIQAAEAETQLIGTQRGQLKAARAMLEIKHELDADPELASIFNAISTPDLKAVS